MNLIDANMHYNKYSTFLIATIIILTVTLHLQPIGFVNAQAGPGDYIVTEYASGKLWRVTPGGVVTLIASGLSGPRGVAIDGSGNYIVAEWSSGELSSVTPGGVVTLIASGLSEPWGVAIVPEPTPEPTREPTQTYPVGGIYTPMNKLNLLVPYVVLIGLIGVFSTILVIRKWRKS